MSNQRATHGADLDAGRRVFKTLPPLMPGHTEADVFACGYARALSDLARIIGVQPLNAVPSGYSMDMLHHIYDELRDEVQRLQTWRTAAEGEANELHTKLAAANAQIDALTTRCAFLSERQEAMGNPPPPCNSKGVAIVGQRPHSHYFHDVRHLDSIDIYRMIELLRIEPPALQHAFKKVAAAGKRGAKDEIQDAREALDSINRFIEMRGEDAAKGQQHGQS